MALTDMVIMPGADYQGACDALRARHGTTGKIKSGDMAQLIEDIPSGGGAELPELTNPGNADTMLYGYQLLDQNGQIVTGEIQSRTSSNVIVNKNQVIVNAGHYKEMIKKSVDTAEQATPSITVSASGLITAKATQSAGYVQSGTKEATKQLPTKAGTTVTPSTTVQTAVPAGTYVTGDVKVAAVPEDTGVELPELTNPGDASKLLAGYQLINGDGEVVDGKMPIVDAATPGVSVQNNGDVVVYVDQAAGYTAGGYKTYKQSQDVIPAKTIMPGTEDQVIPAYHYLTGKQTIKGDPNLTPDNIPEDLTLFGVQGERKLSNVEPPDSLALDPDVVYATTRPKDWLPMPTPGYDEVYLLCHIPDGLNGIFTAIIGTPGSTLIEIGNLVDGEFVAKESITPAHNVRVNHLVNAAEYGDVTADGYTQYLVRIKGNFKFAQLYPGNDAATFSSGVPMVVEAAVGVSAHVAFGYSGTPFHNCDQLRYVRYIGNGRLCGDMAFRQCKHLLSISADNQTIFESMDYMFDGCQSLMAVSGNVLAVGASYAYAFQNCGLPALPAKELLPTSLTGAFRNANAIATKIDFGIINTSNCADFTYLVNNSNVREVRNLDITSLSGALSAFAGARLYVLTFAGATTPGGFHTPLTSALLSHQALVDMINSLPTATAAATITITGNPGAAELTDDEIAVATAKNWTITI